jgi:hypothetical protein
MEHIRLSAGLKKDTKTDDAVQSVDAVFNNLHDIINGGTATKGMLGETNKNIVTISDPNLLKTFSNIYKEGATPIPPSNIEFDKNKDQAVLNYFDPNGKILASIPMSGRDLVKEKVKETYPNKDIGEINNIVDKVISKNGGLNNTLKMYEPQKQVVPPVTSNSYNIKGKKYTHSELNKMGYTDDQIKQAIKIGTIK